MSEIYNPYGTPNNQPQYPNIQDSHTPGAPVVDQLFMNKVFLWMAGSTGAAALGAGILGPLIPSGWLMGLYLVTLGALFAVGLTRKAFNPKVSAVFALVIPAVLGAIIYPTLNYYLATGQGGVVVMSAIGASSIFLIMGLIGWVTQKSMSGWLPYMGSVLLGIILLSLLNAFFFHLPMLSLGISIVSLILFAVYTSVDMQLLRKRVMREGKELDDVPASWFALNLFLDLFNMFIALLNILGRR